MPRDRTVALVFVLAAVTAVTIAILKGLIGTIFFAITVAYVLVPLADRLERRGLPEWWAAAGSTAAAFVFGLALFIPIGAVLYVRRRAAIELLQSLPDSVTVSVGEFAYVVEAGQVTAFLARELTALALSLARSTPVLMAKLVVFAFVVFALVYRGDRLHRALLGPLPDEYHDIGHALNDRVRETLFSLYIIQALTAVATFVVALGLFLVLGVRYPVTLAVLAGVLQFLPVVGPSLVIAGIVIAELLAGDLGGAAVIGVLGVVLVGVLPDALLRPRLARETARLPASLYFVGFTGGLLSLGPVGIIAGPIVVALLIEVLSMLSHEVRPPAVDTGRGT
jgi:predicted PurR-regulated permease PerM